MHLFNREKKIKISDEEREMFDSIWNNYVENQTESNLKYVNEFINYLSQIYKFDRHNFKIFDRKGRLVHARTPRIKETGEFVN